MPPLYRNESKRSVIHLHPLTTILAENFNEETENRMEELKSHLVDIIEKIDINFTNSQIFQKLNDIANGNPLGLTLLGMLFVQCLKKQKDKDIEIREVDNLNSYKNIFNKKKAGSRYFCESFLGIPAQQAAKITRPLMPAAAPAVLSLSFATQQGDSSHHPNDSTRFRKACIFTTQKTLRENTCPIASGDYSTPVSQRET